MEGSGKIKLNDKIIMTEKRNKKSWKNEKQRFENLGIMAGGFLKEMGKGKTADELNKEIDEGWE